MSSAVEKCKSMITIPAESQTLTDSSMRAYLFPEPRSWPEMQYPAVLRIFLFHVTDMSAGSWGVGIYIQLLFFVFPLATIENRWNNFRLKSVGSANNSLVWLNVSSTWSSVELWTQRPSNGSLSSEPLARETHQHYLFSNCTLPFKTRPLSCRLYFGPFFKGIIHPNIPNDCVLMKTDETVVLGDS